MGFNRRKMEDQRRDAAEKEAAARRATDAQTCTSATGVCASPDAAATASLLNEAVALLDPKCLRMPSA